MANIRNQNSWVHRKKPEKATRKAKDQVHMAVTRVTRNYSLQQLQVEVVQKAPVVGGGLAGMNAALSLADQGYPCVLLDQKKRLGGNAWRLHHTDRNEKIRPVLEQLIERVEHHDRIEVIKGARILSVDGSVGNFTSRIEIAGSTRFTTYGVAIIATGAVESRPAEYLYGHDERIMTHLKFDAAMRNSAGQIHRAASVVFIQCVGSREPKQPYCSRACCTHTMQSAISLKTLNPEMNVYVLYRDIRTYGEREILYKNSGPGRYLHSFSPRGQA